MYHITLFGIVLPSCAGKYDIQPSNESKNLYPAIISIKPSCGSFGDTITISGQNFSANAGKNELSVNGTRLPIINSNPSTLKAVVPINLGSGKMTIVVEDKLGIGPEFTNIPSGLITNYVQDISALGIMATKSGDIYFADARNNRIRRYSKSGSRDFLAGSGQADFKDGNGIEASFNYPMDVAVDSKGNIFVTDNNNSCIRKINTNGDVVLYAGNIEYTPVGSSPVPGYNDGVRTEALFNHPTGITIDKNDNLFICDAGNHRIRKITPDDVNYVGEVSTIAGNGNYGSQDGKALEASFSNMVDVVADSIGNIFLIETGNESIRKISANKNVTTIIQGSPAIYTDCGNNKTVFLAPNGLAIDKNGNLYVSLFVEDGNYKIITVSPVYGLNTLVGGKKDGLTQGLGTNVWIKDAGSLAFIGNELFVVSDISIKKIEIK